jgi:hypothetical protein
MPLALGKGAAKQIENQVKLMNELAKHIELEEPEETDDARDDEVLGGAIGKDLRSKEREAVITRAALARFLEEVAPTNYRARR